MKLQTRFLLAFVLIIAGSLVFLQFVLSSTSLEAQTPPTSKTTFISPLAVFRSPLATPSIRPMVSERIKWLFAHDVMDIPRETTRATTNNPAPAWDRTSDFMLGRVVVGIILPESNGTNMLSTENWTSAEIAFVVEEVNQALQWWTQQANDRGISLEFVIAANHPRCRDWL